jgi:hypothetical protein
MHSYRKIFHFIFCSVSNLYTHPYNRPLLYCRFGYSVTLIPQIRIYEGQSKSSCNSLTSMLWHTISLYLLNRVLLVISTCNAPRHTLLVVQQFLNEKNIPFITQPPYSLDLAPSDWWLFPTLKVGLVRPDFTTMKDIKSKAIAERRKIPKEAFHRCFQEWQEQVCVYMCRCNGPTLKALPYVLPLERNTTILGTFRLHIVCHTSYKSLRNVLVIT